MQDMYKAVANSPATRLASNINNTQTTISVVDGSVLPAAPNICTIGTDEFAETIKYTSKQGNNLTGVTRGFQGVARAWDEGTTVGRYFTAYDHDTFLQNIVSAYQEISTLHSEIADTNSAGENMLSLIQGLAASKVDNERVLTNVPLNAKFTDTIYAHPDKHPADMIEETPGKQFTSNIEKAAWDAKWNYDEETIKAVKVNSAVNADTVGGKTVAEDVPAGAKFTDTVYVHPNKHPANIIEETPDKQFTSSSEKATWNAKWNYDEEIIKAVKVNSAVNADTVGGKTVAVDVPAEAKFTDTTYSEITEAEMEGGTGSTRRTITARRMKYLLDKITAWLDDKVDNSRVLTDVPENAKFTDTVYTHPTSAGNKHIPTGGATGQILKYASNGTAKWDAESITEVVDNLTTNSATKALSAKQGMELFQSVSNGKTLIATAITDKGVPTQGSDTFSKMADNIMDIETGGLDVIEGILRYTSDSVSKAGDYTLPGIGYGVTFSPDGNYIALGHFSSPHFTLLKRDGDTVSLASTYTLPDTGYAVSFSPDGNYIALGHFSSPRFTLLKRDGDTVSLASTYTLPGIGNAVSFSPDGNYIAIGHFASPYFTLLKRNGDTVSLASTYTLPGTSYGVSFSPDGQYIAIGHGGLPYFTLLKRDGDTVSLASTYTLPGTGYAVSFSPDGKYIAVGYGPSPRFTLLKMEGTMEPYKVKDKATDAIYLNAKEVAWRNDYSTIHKASEYLLPDTGIAVSFSPDGQYIAIAHRGSPRFTLLKRDGDTVSLASTYTLPSTGWAVSFSPDGKYIAIGHDSSPYFTLLKRDGDTVSLASTYTLPGTGWAVSFSPDGKYIAIGHSASPYFTLLKRDGDTVSLASTYTLPNTGNAVSFSPDGNYIAIGHCASPYFTLLKAGGTYHTQPPTVLEYKGKKYYIVEPNDDLRLIDIK